MRLAQQADVVIGAFGYSPELEGEEGEVAASDGGGDRMGIGLSGVQEELILQLQEVGTPLALVLSGGSPIAFPEIAAKVPAILMAWYPGEEGGNAIADVLFGEVSPAGRLPLTFVKSLEQVPPFADYSMKGRTYRFMAEEPLFRFGFGLSYTEFDYSELELSKGEIGADEEVEVAVTVANVGEVDGDEVVQLYVSDVEASVPVPLRHLEGVRRIHLRAGERQRVSFVLKPEQLAAFDDEGRPFVEAGEFGIFVGGGQPDDSRGGVSGTLVVV